MEEKVILSCGDTSYTIYVDNYTAEMLRNDPAQYQAYAKAASKLLGDNTSMDAPEVNDLASTSYCESKESVGAKPEETVMWASKAKPGSQDEEATLYLIKLRSSEKFEDKKSVKKTLWTEIAVKMDEAGFKMGKNGGERCRQKFANLQARYLQFVTHIKGTGNENRHPPPYFDQMHDLLASKAKAFPKYVINSSVGNEASQQVPNVTNKPSTSNMNDSDEGHHSLMSQQSIDRNETDSEEDPVRHIEKKRKFKTGNDKIIDLIKQCHEDDKLQRNVQFSQLKELLKTQNQQRERLLTIFEKTHK